MMIQPLLRSQAELANDGRSPGDSDSPNEVFARALADSIRSTRTVTQRAMPGIHGGSGDAQNRAERGADHASDTALARRRMEPGRPDQPGAERSDRADQRHDPNQRADAARSDRRGPDRSQDRTDSDNGRRDETTNNSGGVTNDGRVDDGAGTTGRVDDQSDDGANSDAGDDELNDALAALLGVDPAQAGAFLQALMAGVTETRGPGAAAELLAGLTALADDLTAGSADMADGGLIDTLVDAAVDAGLLESTNLDGDPAEILAALTSALVGGSDADADGGDITMDGVAGSDTPGEIGGDTVDVDDSLLEGLDQDGANSATDTVADDTVADDTVADDTAGADAGAQGTTDGADGPPAVAGNPAGRPVPDGAPGSAPNGVGAINGVGSAVRTPATARTAPPAQAPAEGLVELVNTRLAEQLRPAFAAVRRTMDGMDELQLRLRTEGGAPIKVDISTADDKVRVVLSGTNDDVMQRLGQERERLADELRRAGFSSTSIDVHSESADANANRAGNRERANSFGYEPGAAGRHETDDLTVDVSGRRKPTSGLDLDL